MVQEVLTLTHHDNHEDVLQQVEKGLEQAHEQLKQAECREKYVGMRVEHYKKLLEREQQRPERRGDIEEGTKMALDRVIAIHEQLAQQVKTFRRQVLTLEKKRDDLNEMTEECREFLVAAAQQEEQEHPEPFLDDDDEDLEANTLKEATTIKKEPKAEEDDEKQGATTDESATAFQLQQPNLTRCSFGET